jgi:DNA-binding response OmpR family regulator
MPLTPVPPSQAILVVDDDPAIREALAASLAASYPVHTAACGTDAVAVLRAHAIAGIILDAILQDEHGLDLVPRFRTLSAAPILVLTGQGSEALAARAIWTGVEGYLNKPVSVAALHVAMAKLLRRSEAPSDLVAQARRSLEAHLPTRFQADAWARAMGTGEAQLRRLFRETFGRTPRRHLTEVRLARAAVLLRTTTRGIKEIAQDAGYASHTRFGKAFHTRYGVTPSAYRAGDGPHLGSP